MSSKELDEQAAGALRRAADLLEEQGYIKGRLRNEHGAHCALGAIYDSCAKIHISNVNISFDVRKRAVAALAEPARALLPSEGIYDKWNYVTVYPDPQRSTDHKVVFAWNNNICNSAAEVACLMRSVAQSLEADE